MNPRNIRRPSVGLIVAMIALVAALTGSAIALPGKNTVQKNDIKKKAVTTKAIKDLAVTSTKIADNAVTSAKIADGAVTGADIADGGVTGTDIANDAINSSKVQDESINGSDLAPGVVSVVAYGKIHNPSPGGPVIVSGDVGLQSVAVGSGSADDDGRTDVTIDASVLGPTASLAQCTAQATAAADPSPNGSLGFDSVTLAMGPPAGNRIVEVQTRGSGEVLNDFDYYLQVTCPNV